MSRRGPVSNGQIGEVLALGQIVRRDIEAYQPPNPTAEHDIVAVIRRRALRIEVNSKVRASDAHRAASN